MQNFDEKLIGFFNRISLPFSRFAIFVIYFWFGILKFLGFSPAETLVRELFNQTIHFISFDTFYIFFALFEMLIGVLFLFPRATRVVIPLLVIHLITTFMPLVFLQSVAWSAPLVPTLVGQYIIKNLVIIACAVSVAGNLHARHTEKQIA